MLLPILKLHNYAALMTGLMQRVASEFSRSISETTKAEIGGGTTLYFLFSYIFLYILYIIHKLNSIMILLVILTIQTKF